MGHVNNLKATLPAREPALHLAGHIDDLHLKNHKDPTYHENYNSKSMREVNPDLNTVACEQTFA